ncbi:MAG: hypothetical protein SFX73_36610 [Kofleriaceae bacterium]|nr:hypothetical protein [Kofleriaceae bacterium]
MSRYDLFRKRIAPIAFILALGLLIRQSCQQAERFHATIVLDYGTQEAKVRAVDARLVVDGEAFGELRRAALPNMTIGVTKFEVALPQRDAELQINVDVGEAAPRHIVRLIHAEENATVTVPLADDLR